MNINHVLQTFTTYDCFYNNDINRKYKMTDQSYNYNIQRQLSQDKIWK